MCHEMLLQARAHKKLLHACARSRVFFGIIMGHPVVVDLLINVRFCKDCDHKAILVVVQEFKAELRTENSKLTEKN